MSDKTLALGDMDIPVLDDWIGLTEAATRIGVSRQYVHKLAQQGAFKTLHKIAGARGDTFVVHEDEVSHLASLREARLTVEQPEEEEFREDF